MKKKPGSLPAIPSDDKPWNTIWKRESHRILASLILTAFMDPAPCDHLEAAGGD